MTRLLSLVALVCLWQIAAHFANPRLLPGPMAVLTTMRSEAASGALFAALGVTLARVAAAFLLAMAAGSAISAMQWDEAHSLIARPTLGSLCS